MFVPFGYLIATDSALVARETELRALRIVSRIDEAEGHKLYDDHTSHEERVRALCRMADLMDMVDRAPSGVN